MAGLLLRDVVLTRDELRALTMGLLVSDRSRPARIQFRTWVAEHGTELGRSYASELERNFRLRTVDSAPAESSLR
jgi:hypothetical protein